MECRLTICSVTAGLIVHLSSEPMQRRTAPEKFTWHMSCKILPNQQSVVKLGVEYRMRAMLPRLAILLCSVIIIQGKLVLQENLDQHGAAVKCRSNGKSIIYSVQFTTKIHKRSFKDTLYNWLHGRKSQKRLSHILELAERKEPIQEASIEDSKRHIVINIPNLLNKQATVTNVCIDLSKRHLSINQDMCLLPLLKGVSDDKYLLKNGMLQLRRVSVGTTTISPFSPLTINLDDAEMMIPVRYTNLIEKILNEKGELKLSLLGGPPIIQSYGLFGKSSSGYTFNVRPITFHEDEEWRLGRTFMSAFNVQIFKDYYKIGFPLRNEML